MGSGASAAARRYEAPDKLAEAADAIDWEALDATERAKVKAILRKAAADDASGARAAASELRGDTKQKVEEVIESIRWEGLDEAERAQVRASLEELSKWTEESGLICDCDCPFFSSSTRCMGHGDSSVR